MEKDQEKIDSVHKKNDSIHIEARDSVYKDRWMKKWMEDVYELEERLSIAHVDAFDLLMQTMGEANV